MKTLELKLPIPVLLVWGLPEDALFLKEDVYSNGVYYLSKNDGKGWFKLSKGNWQLIGKLSELTEEQASTIVGKNYWDMSTGGYIDYNSEEPTDNYTFALESFHSAIEVEGYYLEDVSNEVIEKELGIHGHDIGLTESEYQDWIKENGSKILPANTLIFKRV